ncbi:MAG: anhydro-N-acetylmuramic acid kinase, partial [Chitinophagaceae bacterium]
MVYRVLGLMSGSSLDGVDLACVDFQQVAGRWIFQVHATACVPYDATWRSRLQSATSLAARDYQLLHVSYGHYLGELVNQFLSQHQLHYQVQLIAAHGHTTFHMPSSRMTHQLGDGAALAASTGINTVTDLRAMDVALGGQGAPIVPIGEKLLWPDYSCFLNLGGICNLSVMTAAGPLAFDVCPANKVLNLLAQLAGVEFDRHGDLSRTGIVHPELLQQLDQF